MKSCPQRFRSNVNRKTSNSFFFFKIALLINNIVVTSWPERNDRANGYKYHKRLPKSNTPLPFGFPFAESRVSNEKQGNACVCTVVTDDQSWRK